jgi:hypothetical protein
MKAVAQEQKNCRKLSYFNTELMQLSRTVIRLKRTGAQLHLNTHSSRN